MDGYQHRAGEAWVWILGALVATIEELCADPDVQMAIQELWHTGTFRLMLDEAVEVPWACEFLDGELILTGRTDCVLSHLETIGADIVERL